MNLLPKGRHRRPTNHRLRNALGVVGISMVALTGCTVSTPVDQAALVYHGGHHAKTFKKYFPAGTREGGKGANDDEYRYPVNSRDFQFDVESVAGRERGPIEVLAKNGIKMTVTGAVYFTLNDKKEILQKFHEQIGTNYGPTDHGLDKWNDMLAKYIGVPVENALDRVSLNYTVEELTGDPTKKNEWQAAAAKQIVDSIKQVTGGEPYFCKPNYKPNSDDTCGEFSISLNQAQPPTNITEANADAAAQAKRNSTATNSAETQKGLIALYGVQGYIQMQQLDLMRQALVKGNVPFLTVPQGGSIVVPATK